ncbi:MAG: DNA polymerase III subunit delta' [Planctomycetes bacterium]|nr:DNA polymerase III subunit delta' [Planctomycetota bacterium]
MSWQRIIGHQPVIDAFQRARARGRLAHAYLFTGPAGVGKRLFAGELAKAILCESDANRDKIEACDQCPACALVDAGTHPDWQALARPEDKNVVPIELMQELCQTFALKSARGKGKVAILDDADDLSAEAANCFLKTLEEPPLGSIFILVGSSPERQMATIRSRCQLVRFRPLDAEAMNAWFDQHGIESHQRARLTKLSGGSPGQALALADPELWTFRQSLLTALSQPQPDAVALSKSWMEFIEEAGKDTAAQRRRCHLVLQLLMAFLEDALAVSLADLEKPAGEDAVFLADFCRRVSEETILAMLDRCLEAEFHLDRYVQLALAVESLVDALTASA